MDVFGVLVVLMVALLSSHDSFAAAAPIAANSVEEEWGEDHAAAPLVPLPSDPQAGEMDGQPFPRPLPHGPLPNEAGGVAISDPSPPARGCECCETQLREIVDEILQQRASEEDQEDQTPTRTK